MDETTNGDGTVVRSEEELRVTKVRRPRTRVRLRKYIVTEMVTTTVPVQREEVRLEREAITDLDAGSLSPDAAPEELREVVLHEEQLVIEKRVVPVERVRMLKETITDQQTVSDEIRKEQIETSGQVTKGTT